METRIALTMKEQKRVEVMQRVFRRELGAEPDKTNKAT